MLEGVAGDGRHRRREPGPETPDPGAGDGAAPGRTTSRRTPTASTRRRPRTRRRSSAAPTAAPDRWAQPQRALRRRVGIDAPAPRRARTCSGVTVPAVRALVAVVVGRRALEQHRARVVADRADRGDLVLGEHRPVGTLASSSRLRSIGFASGPGSWIRVGRDALDRRVREVPDAGELSGVSPWRSAIGRMRSSFSRPASTHPSGRKPRWSWSAKPCPGSTSSWNRPP